MKKTVITVFSICSLITLANGQIGINADTKTKDMTNYGGKVEISSKYENEVVKFDGKSKIVKYEDNTLKSIIAEDFYAKLNLDLLKSEKHEVKLGAYITKNGEDAYKIEDKNDKAEAYLSYTNRLTKNVELSTMTKLGTEILDDFTFDKGYFIQGLKGKVKLGNYTNTLGITYKYDKHHNLELVNRNELDINKVNIAVSPKISFENIGEKFERLLNLGLIYKLGLDIEANADIKNGKFSSKLYTEFGAANEKYLKNKTGLELGADLVFGNLKFNPKASTEFISLGLSRKPKKKDPLRIDENKLESLYDLVNIYERSLYKDGFYNTSKLSLETEYTVDNFEIKIKPEFEANIMNILGYYYFDNTDNEKFILYGYDIYSGGEYYPYVTNNSDEYDNNYHLLPEIYETGPYSRENKKLFVAKLDIEAKAKINDNIDLKVVNKLRHELDRKTIKEKKESAQYDGNYYNFYIKNKSTHYIENKVDLIKLISNDITLSADLHKNIDGFKLSLIPSFNFIITQKWGNENYRMDMKYIAEPKKDNKNEYEIQGTPFISLTPKIEFKLEKEFKNNVVLDLGVNGSKTYNIIRYSNGLVKFPDGQDKGLDFSSKKSSYEIGGNLGLTYKF